MTRRAPAAPRISRRRNRLLAFVAEMPGAILVGVGLGFGAVYGVRGIVHLAGIVWGWL